MFLPQDFIDYTSALFGTNRWQKFLGSFEQEPAVSLRFNPWKYKGEPLFEGVTPVPWCRQGVWLKARPNFTLDPLFHAGVYYVQEAGSLFLDHVVREQIASPVSVLDLCAAPGGKSTLMRAALPKGSMLVCNEIDRHRAHILAENMIKQGHSEVLVTHNAPKDFAKTKQVFDVILADVPCSGEGLFRRDLETVKQWSRQNVLFCQERQRQILRDIWPCLRSGGLFIYSTCTFNLQENEENVRWITQELGAEVLPVTLQADWQITGSLLTGWQEPVYRFIPGITQSEGFFLAVLRKKAPAPAYATLPASLPVQLKKYPFIHCLSDGNPTAEMRGKEKIPSAAQALSLTEQVPAYPQVALSLEQARRYLHRESLTLPDGSPSGFVLVTYQGYRLGFVKNLGMRANNLYPKPWAIRSL